MSESLSLGQKVFHQRLLAEHCMSEPEATALFEELQGTYPDLNDEFRTLHDCIKSSNAQLKHLGLEIVAIAMPAKFASASAMVNDDDDEEEDEDDDMDQDDEENDENTKRNSQKKSSSSQSRPRKRSNTSSSPPSSSSHTVLYYAIVNKHPDDIAKMTWQPAIFQPLSQQSFVKAVLERLVQDGAATRTTLLNLKNTVLSTQTEGAAASERLTLAHAEDALERLLDEKWLVPVESKKRGGRQSMSGKAGVVLGPRAFCELSYFLTEQFEMDANEIPQQIVLI